MPKDIYLVDVIIRDPINEVFVIETFSVTTKLLADRVKSRSNTQQQRIFLQRAMNSVMKAYVKLDYLAKQHTLLSEEILDEVMPPTDGYNVVRGYDPT